MWPSQEAPKTAWAGTSEHRLTIDSRLSCTQLAMMLLVKAEQLRPLVGIHRPLEELCIIYDKHSSLGVSLTNSPPL